MEYTELKIQFRALENILMPPFKGSAFRGVFGMTLRNSVCVTGAKTCEGCRFTSKCSYFNIFETEGKNLQITYIRGVIKTPHPFILIPPLEQDTFYSKGQNFSVIFRLFGEAINDYPFVLLTFNKIGKEGIGFARKRFEMTDVMSKNSEGRFVSIFDYTTKNVTDQPFRLNISDIPASAGEKKYALRFRLPLRLQKDSKPVFKPEFVTPEFLMYNIYRRYLTINALFGIDEPKYKYNSSDCDRIKTEHNGLTFTHTERYSNRQDAKISLSGFTGDLTLTGYFPENIDFLMRSGQIFGLGKSTAFGSGSYELTEIK